MSRTFTQQELVVALRIADAGLLAPKFRGKVNRVVQRMRGEGHRPRIFETFRLAALQQHYFTIGSSKQRDILRSTHGHGLAVDIICMDRLWDATPEFWDALDRACAAEGLTWGGNWKTFVDKPHVQWGSIAGAVPDGLVRAYNEGGLTGSWMWAGAM